MKKYSMKKFILVFSLLVALSSCETKPFKGFLVCKEYVLGHMDDERPHIKQEAYVYVPIVVPRIHKSKYVPSEWHFYVANKHGVRVFNVDSLTYTKHKVGERIAMNY